MARRKIPLRYYRNMSNGEAKFFAYFMVTSMVVVATFIFGFFIYSDSLPTAEQKAEAQEKLEESKALATLSSLPSDCHRAAPVKTHKQEGYYLTDKKDRSAPQKQVENFYVMGVQLYVPIKDAMIAAQASGNFNKLPKVVFDSCASDWIERDNISRLHQPGNEYPEVKKSCIKSMTYSGQGVSLGINFVEDYPRQPKCLVVSSVGISEEGRKNSASIENWNKALQEKYGPPHPFSDYWGSSGNAQLSNNSYYGRFSIILDNTSFSEERIQAGRDAVSDAKPVAKPRL